MWCGLWQMGKGLNKFGFTHLLSSSSNYKETTTTTPAHPCVWQGPIGQHRTKSFWFLFCCHKTLWPKPVLGRKSHNPPSKETHAWPQGRTWSRNMEQCCLLTCSPHGRLSLLSYEPRTVFPDRAQPTIGWSSHINMKVRKCPQAYPWANLMAGVPQLWLPLPRWLSWGRVDKN